MTIVEAARRRKANEQSISRWKQQFLESGKAGLSEGEPAGPNARERQIEAEVEEPKTALGEAHVELRVWKKSVEQRLGLRRTSR